MPRAPHILSCLLALPFLSGGRPAAAGTQDVLGHGAKAFGV